MMCGKMNKKYKMNKNRMISEKKMVNQIRAISVRVYKMYL